MITVAIFLLIPIIGLGLWYNDCQAKASIQMLKMLNSCMQDLARGNLTSAHFEELMTHLAEPAYSNHVWRLFTLRHPHNLYPLELSKRIP
jgi:hypothetical protein